MRTQKNWILFFIGILISTFLGGAVRVLLSPAFVRQWVEDIVAHNQPKFTFEFSEAKMSFGRGWVPQIAVELADLRVQAKDPCVTGGEISVNQIIIPLNLRSLMAGKVRFGHIDADRVSYYHRPRKCEGAKVEQTFDFAAEIAPLENFFQRRWSKEVMNTTRFFDEFSMTEFRMTAADQIEPYFYLRNLHLAFFKKIGEAEFRFDFWPGNEAAGDQPFGPTATVIRVSKDAIKWIAAGNLKEGQIHSEGQWLVEPGQYQFRVDWKDVPLTNFMALMYRWKFSTLHALNISNEWFSCGFSGKGELRNLARNSLAIDACEFYGDTGRAQLRPVTVTPRELAGLEYELQVNQVDVRRISQAFGYDRWSNHLAKIGTFSGRVKTKLQGAFQAEGLIKNVEIYLGDFGLPSQRAVIQSADIWVDAQMGRFALRFADLRGPNLPANTEIKIQRKEDSVSFIMKAPEVEFSGRWPLAKAILERIERNAEGSNLEFNDFVFSFELAQNSFLDWQIKARQGRVAWQGRGVLMDDQELHGDLILKESPKNKTFKLTGILREPVVANGQNP